MRKNNHWLKTLTVSFLPVFLLASCGSYSKQQDYYFNLIKDQKNFDNLWGINQVQEKKKTKSSKPQKGNDNDKDLIFYIGISSCPYCHALKDLDQDATDAMNSYMGKNGENALDGWFKSNTEKGYGPLNIFTKDIKQNKKYNWNLDVEGTFITGYKPGQFPSGDNWTDGLKPDWQWVGSFIDELKNDSKAPFYQWDDASKTFTQQGSFDYSIPMLIFAKHDKSHSQWTKNYRITGYVTGYLTKEQLWQAYMQFISTK